MATMANGRVSPDFHTFDLKILLRNLKHSNDPNKCEKKYMCVSGYMKF